jgi:hypothetical protein
MGEYLSWVDPTGLETPLNAEPYVVGWGRTGLWGVPTKIVSQQVPLLDGARFKFVEIDPNRPKIPLLITGGAGGGEATLAQNRRALFQLLNPKRGIGTLRSYAADGVIRDLPCYYSGGLDSHVEDGGARGTGWAIVGLEFDALQPYWQDKDAFTSVYTPGAASNFFGTFFPLHISPAGVSSSFSLTNTGDAECWPVWTINGPGSAITLTNNTTGKSIALTANGGITLIAGQSVTIDTRPLFKTVKDQSGTSQFGKMTTASALWSLIIGLNNISLSMTGTGAASSIQLQYRQLYTGM